VLGPQVGKGKAEEITWCPSVVSWAFAAWFGINPAINPAAASERIEARIMSFIVVNLWYYLKILSSPFRLMKVYLGFDLSSFRINNI